MLFEQKNYDSNELWALLAKVIFFFYYKFSSSNSLRFSVPIIQYNNNAEWTWCDDDKFGFISQAIRLLNTMQRQPQRDYFFVLKIISHFLNEFARLRVRLCVDWTTRSTYVQCNVHGTDCQTHGLCDRANSSTTY